MGKPIQDIYGTRREGQHEREQLLPPGRQAERSKPLVDEWRRNKRYMLLFRMIILLCSVFFGIIVFQQYLLYERPSGARKPAILSRPVVILPRRDAELDAKTSYLFDELDVENTAAAGVGEKGVVGIGTIKQAAYQIVLAEKAGAEERWDDAIAGYESALNTFPAMHGVYEALGLIYLKQKNYADAVRVFEAAASRGEMSYVIANNLAVAYLAQEDYPKAENYLRKVLSLNPDYTLAYYNLAMLYLRSGDLKKSADFLAQYLERNPKDVDAQQNFALVLIQLKRWNEAALVLEPLSRSTPGVAPVHFYLAQALAHKGDTRGSIAALKKGSTLLDPRKALAWLAKSEYDNLRSDDEFQKLTEDLSSARKP